MKFSLSRRAVCFFVLLGFFLLVIPAVEGVIDIGGGKQLFVGQWVTLAAQGKVPCDNQGSITVAVLDENGKALRSFEHRQCISIRGDSIRFPVTWRGKAGLRTLRGKAVRLEFMLKNAKLYSFQVN